MTRTRERPTDDPREALRAALDAHNAVVTSMEEESERLAAERQAGAATTEDENG